MSNPRAGKTGLGTHEYRDGSYLITQMATGVWYIFDKNGYDLGFDFKTLAAARKWLKTQVEK
jgi:hypothetical protein